MKINLHQSGEFILIKEDKDFEKRYGHINILGTSFLRENFIFKIGEKKTKI